MTSVPYPSFRKSAPVSVRKDGTSTALAAVGRCRVEPMNLVCRTGDDCDYYTKVYQSIVDINTEQAHVKLDMSKNNTNLNKDDKKALEKKLMKQGVAMAKYFLLSDLQLDVSIVDVEIVLPADHVVRTDGCLAACFLDAGCDCIVIAATTVARTRTETTKIENESASGNTNPESEDWINYVWSVDAFECTGVPRERLLVDLGSIDMYSSVLFLEDAIAQLQRYCKGCSVTVTLDDSRSSEGEDNDDKAKLMIHDQLQKQEDFISKILSLGTKEMKVVVQISSNKLVEDFEDYLPKLVGQCCTRQKESNAILGIALVDPTPELLGRCYGSCLKTDRPDQLYTTVVCTRSGVAIGLVYSTVESIVAALQCGRGVYYSRSRQQLWRKGDTSGMYQILHRIDVDCDGDALRFTVTQRAGGNSNTTTESKGTLHGTSNDDNNNNGIGSFCHLNTLTCWGPGRGLDHLQDTLRQRLQDAPEGSYTKRLFCDSELLRHKLVEEAQELAEATTKQHVAEELADVLYFAMTRAALVGVTIDDAVRELDQRSRKVTRRPGNSKPFRIAAANNILSLNNDISSNTNDN